MVCSVTGDADALQQPDKLSPQPHPKRWTSKLKMADEGPPTEQRCVRRADATRVISESWSISLTGFDYRLSRRIRAIGALGTYPKTILI
jgi:hypothetical protein